MTVSSISFKGGRRLKLAAERSGTGRDLSVPSVIAPIFLPLPLLSGDCDLCVAHGSAPLKDRSGSRRPHVGSNTPRAWLEAGDGSRGRGSSSSREPLGFEICFCVSSILIHLEARGGQNAGALLPLRVAAIDEDGRDSLHGFRAKWP